MKSFTRKFLILTKHLISEKWKFELIILAIMILGFILRIYKIGDYGLWIDEITSLRHIESGFFSIMRNLSLHSVHPPFYFWFLHLWVKFFGDTHFVLRLPSLIFGIITIYLIYLIGSNLFDKKVGLYSSFLGAISLHHIFHSQEVRMYTLLPLLAFLSFFLFYRLLKENRPFLRFLYIIVSIIMVYTHLYGLLIIFSQLCYALFFLKQKKKLVMFFLMQILIFLIYLPIIYNIILPRIPLGYKTWHSHPGLLTIYSVIMAYSGFLPLFFYHYFLKPSFCDLSLGLCVTIAYLFISISLFKLLKSNRKNRDFFEKIILLLFYFGSVTILPFLISFMKPLFDWRYTITAFPAFCILAGLGWAKISLPIKKIIIFLIFVTSLTLNYFSYSIFPRATNENLANFINKTMNDGDKLVVVRYEYYKKFLNYFLPNTKIESFPSPDFYDSISTLQENQKVILVGNFYSRKGFKSIQIHLNNLNFKKIIRLPFENIFRRRVVEVYIKKKRE